MTQMRHVTHSLKSTRRGLKRNFNLHPQLADLKKTQVRDKKQVVKRQKLLHGMFRERPWEWKQKGGRY